METRDTSRWVVCVTARSRASNEATPQSALEEQRMAMKNYSDDEVVRSRGYGLVSTVFGFGIFHTYVALPTK